MKKNKIIIFLLISITFSVEVLAQDDLDDLDDLYSEEMQLDEDDEGEINIDDDIDDLEDLYSDEEEIDLEGYSDEVSSDDTQLDQDDENEINIDELLKQYKDDLDQDLPKEEKKTVKKVQPKKPVKTAKPKEPVKAVTAAKSSQVDKISDPTEVMWINFELNLNYITQTGGAYSIGGGLAYTPIFKNVIKTGFYDFSFAPRFGLQLAKGESDEVIPIYQIALGIPFMFSKKVFLTPHFGFGSATVSDSKSTFKLVGFDFGSFLDTSGLRLFNRCYLRYSAMLSGATTYQLEFGFGFNI